MSRRILFSILFGFLFSSSDAQYFEAWKNDLKDSRLRITFLDSDLRFYHQPFSFGDILFDEGNNLIVDLTKVVDDFDKENFGLASGEVTTIKVDYLLDEFLFSAGHGISYQGAISYPRELGQLAVLGNAAFIGKTIEVGPSFFSRHYQHLFIGGTYQGDRISLGGRIKILAGTEWTQTEAHQIMVTTDENNFALTLNNDYQLYSSGILTYRGIDDLDSDFDPGRFTPFFSRNGGFSFDMDIHFHLDPSITISGFVENLGYITWDSQLELYEKKAVLPYEGVDLADFLSDEQEISISDSLYALLDLDRISLERHRDVLPWSAGVALQWEASTTQVLAIQGGITDFQIQKVGWWMAEYRHRSGILEGQLTWTGFGKSYDNLGIGVGLYPGGFFVEASLDNVLGVLDLLSTRYNRIAFKLGLEF